MMGPSFSRCPRSTRTRCRPASTGMSPARKRKWRGRTCNLWRRSFRNRRCTCWRRRVWGGRSWWGKSSPTGTAPSRGRIAPWWWNRCPRRKVRSWSNQCWRRKNLRGRGGTHWRRTHRWLWSTFPQHKGRNLRSRTRCRSLRRNEPTWRWRRRRWRQRTSLRGRAWGSRWRGGSRSPLGIALGSRRRSSRTRGRARR